MLTISQFIKPDMEVARSVNLERDAGSIDIVNDYQVTDKTREVLSRFGDALLGEKISAWSLTGPYGMGKSSFINYLLALTSPSNTDLANRAWQKLNKSDPDLFKKLFAGISKVADQGFLQIPVTASYEAVNTSILRGLNNALSLANIPKKEKLLSRLNKIALNKDIDSQILLEIIKEAMLLTKMPAIIVIDEFGKNLDFMSHHPHKGDIFLLQQLAELDSLYIWLSLHQAFDEYAAGLSTNQQQEWRKIQGRFEDISFVETTGQMLEMISRALKQSDDPSFKQALSKWAKEAFDSISNTKLSQNSYFTLEKIKDIYPLHPITAISLIELCRRFAQNDRTLLSFLCSGDRNALPAFLNQEISKDYSLPTVGLDYLYDYFFNISANAPSYQAESQRWLEIHNIISEAGDLSEQETALLKTIGVLNLLSGFSGISANYEIICSVMKYSKGYEPKQVKKWLDELIQSKNLFYREFANELRLWEGSDFDVYGAIREQKAKMAITSLEQVLQEYLPLSPFVASRHAFETGTVRRFERRWMSTESLNEDLEPAAGFDGLFVYCFGTLPKPLYVPTECADGRPIIIAYVSSQTTLVELALEVAAARYVFENSPELEHDRVARKEVSFRVNMAEVQFRNYLSQVYSPHSEDILWYSQGHEITINGSKKLSEEVSRLCDDCYSACPHIGNEMINYDRLSSAAARARRELVEAMAVNEEQEHFGLTGYGPEVAVYRSLILAKGLHCKDQEGWHLVLSREDQRFASLWDKIEQCIVKSREDGISVANILDELRKPPFGMRQGVAPIYLCLYLLAKADDIAIFQENSYVPYLTKGTIALLVKRPDLFTLKRFVTSGIEQRVFNIYRKLIKKVNLQGNVKLRNATMLGVVGPLIKYMEALTLYSRNTREISLEAQRVRSAVINSTEPMQLLFEDIPKAVGIDLNDQYKEANWQEELQMRLLKALDELEQAYPRLNQRVQQALLEVFRQSDIVKLKEIQVKRIKPLVQICSDSELKPILQAFIRTAADIDDWVKGIAGIIVKKPLDAWNDHDFMPFVANLRDYVDRIDQLEALNTFGSNSKSDAVLLSVMDANGKLTREIFNSSPKNKEIVDRKVKEILSLPESTEIILELVKSLLGGESYGDR
jgi:hypothetical protein